VILSPIQEDAMRASHLTAVLALLAAGSAAAQQTVPATNPTAHALVIAAGDLQWGPAPPALPAGAQAVVLEGNPGEAGPFTIRLRFPDGYRIAPHTHPATERVTVLSGHLMVGMGTQFIHEQMQSLMAGAYASMPADMQHYAMSHGETVIQINGMGPFALNYVNPTDDPRNQPHN
jgi:quercetin dioxygenase-like cupin family protein